MLPPGLQGWNREPADPTPKLATGRARRHPADSELVRARLAPASSEDAYALSSARIERASTAASIDAAPVARVVDTTGAGDLYASGFLFGLTRGLPLPICGEIGSLCAAEIISHVGARPEVNLAQLIAERGRAL